MNEETTRVIDLLQRESPKFQVRSGTPAMRAAEEALSAGARRTEDLERFWEETDPGAKTLQRLQFAKNLSVLGGLILAAVDTEGRPGVAWRAQRAARDLRREAGHLGNEAKLEARLAAAKVR